MAKPTRFDLALFMGLNEEYRAKPVVARPRSFDESSLHEAAEQRLRSVERRVALDNRRVLEIGCGRGHIGRRLADTYGCEVVGVDIKEYPQWSELSGNGVDLRVHDVSLHDNGPLGQFDVILSFAVWEHIVHPYGALQGVKQLLAPGGRAYLYANLYRGPKASHRYREVFFPWPHLLFTDEVFREFYKTTTGRPRPSAWVNKLTAAQYLFYFDQLDLVPEQLWYSPDAFDQDFYDRFEAVLGRYPKWDLSHDFIHAVLVHRETAPPLPIATEPDPSFTRRTLRWGKRNWSRVQRRLRRAVTGTRG
jgi:cyclopropane fatty-acyl-phospholipid synthase-like methyltransferase